MNFEFISVAESHYRAIMDKSALTMKIYMNSSMGVGEHPQVFDEVHPRHGGVFKAVSARVNLLIGRSEISELVQ